MLEPVDQLFDLTQPASMLHGDEEHQEVRGICSGSGL